MKLVQVAEANKKYYTKEFIHGFNIGAKTQYEADKKEAERTGRWIFKTDRRIVDGYDWQCDQCGSWQMYTSNYCPRCGAKMDEVEE